MQFESLAAFWHMNGHGPFVWSAYAIAVVVLLALVVIPLRRSRRLLAELRASERRRVARAAMPADSSSAAS